MKKNGQSLIELVISLGVILIVLLALAALGIKTLSNADYSKKKVQASKYAQEGMEYVRRYRDNSDWATFSSSNSCSTMNNIILSQGLLGLTNPFTRTITCTDLGGNKLKIVVIVSWANSISGDQSELVSYFTDKKSW